jgi:D-glycero-alpha-D-manno-heptose 1-phosphate guanylyltransferase
MITEAIVLAGGLGTRLKQLVPDLPKSLAPIAGRPFMSYLLDYVKKEGIKKFVFALGYKTELIENFVKGYLPKESYRFSIETEPLGTGGAVYKACNQITSRDSIVLNADTFFSVSFSKLYRLHEQQNADCTLALKSMTDFDRYGAVSINEKMEVTGFSEKKHQTKGLINGGVYALNTESFIKRSFPDVFSFEKDYLEENYQKGKILGFVSDAYFIDIGIPEDYNRAQIELPTSITHF